MDLNRLLITYVGWCLVMSGASLIMLAWDKRQAQRNGWRIAEASLHIVELIGGWGGTLAAQALLRHKSRKIRYRLVLWCIIALHAAGIALAVKLLR
jgi:uncharacterized membrane protein YsdA (DUF1294 family)